ncbi:PTS sugar transporter subunit IIA [Enterococcus faecalis]|nr:PTS sugar transporter subunit IIA [Enterococcus faecalis]
MNERMRTILKLMIQKPELKLVHLADELGLTLRQINYALAQFNEELMLQKLPTIQRNQRGDIFVPLEVVQLFSKAEVKEQDDIFYSENERTALLLVALVVNLEYVSLDHLVDFLGVSKNTILEDVKQAEWLAEKYSLKINYTRLNGYQLIGEENQILQLLLDLVHLHPIIQREPSREKLVSNVSEQEVVHLVHHMEQLLHLSYSDESLDYLQTAARFILSRGLQQTEAAAFFKGSVKATPEYRMLLLLLSETEWQLAESYQEWLALLFLTSNIFEKKTSQDYDSDFELRTFIHQMVEAFQQQTLISIEDRENFERRILSHLRPACFRIQYNLSLGIYSLENVVQENNHAILIQLMKELIIPIENWLGKAFPYDELELLSYYFGFQLSNHQMLKQKPRAVVVCANGVMVSKLMRENLKKLFPEIHFFASFSVRDFYQFEEDYDLVFTTTTLKSKITQFVIEPIMTDKEQIRLRYRVLNTLGLASVDQSLENLLQTIQRYAQITDRQTLKEELQYFLIKENQSVALNDFDTLPGLTYYLRPNYIQISEQLLTWQQAIQVACQPLLSENIINQTFVYDCLKQIEAPDYSGFLGMETCIPHTTVEKGVLKDGVSLYVSKEPILFPGGQKIHFIFPLAFFDLTKHLRAINQLADLSNDVALLDRILQTTETKTIYQLIRKNT